MVRTAVGRVRRSAIAVVTVLAVSLVVDGIAAASPLTAARVQTGSEEQLRRVNQIIAELDRLGEQIDALAEDYALAINDMEDLEVEIAATEKRIAEKEKELAAMQGELKDVALKSFIRGGSSGSLSSILSSTSSLSDIVRKRYLTSSALNTGAGNADALQGVIEDLAKERTKLAQQRKRAEEVAVYTASRLDAAESMAAQYEARQAAAEAQYGALLRSERQRREDAALEAARSQAAKFQGSKYANVVAPSSKAGLAIKAALSQLGVRYRFGAKSPGVAFDCSGLTSYAWGAAGVGIPRTSRTQYAGLTRIPTAAIQPGDLIFSGYPIHHVGMYLGNGQMVHAPRTGDVVKVSAVYWSRVVGVARPR